MLLKYLLPDFLFKRSVCTFSQNFFRLTAYLFAEPLKKRKRIDPAIIKQREDRWKKRIAKQIRRLERNALQLKPITECEVPLEIASNTELHIRQTDEAHDKEFRTAALKEWCSYKNQLYARDIAMIARILQSQTVAFENLKLTSATLYAAAVQAEIDLIPWKSSGPVETPQIEGYDSPDGEFIDITKNWDKI